MASLLPNARQQFTDANGKPYAGGSVMTYVPGTTTPKQTWSDAAQTALNTNPVVLDAAGTATIYGSGQYRQILKDAAFNTIWDSLTSGSGSGGSSPLDASTVGADPSGVSDSTAAIQSCLDSGRNVFLPPGTYKITASLQITQANQVFFGGSQFGTILLNTTAASPTIVWAAYTSGAQLYNMTLSRSVTATSGGDGIYAIQSNLCSIRNIYSTKNWRGFSLGICGYNVFESCIADSNLAAGVYLSNFGINAPAQWYLNGVLSQMNGGQGFFMQSTDGVGTVGTSIGDWTNLRSFANAGAGCAFVGTTQTPVQGVRVRDCFFGSDGASEIYLDTYGDQHNIQNCFVEICGIGGTGPGQTTAASHLGYGIQITGNNTGTRIDGCHVEGCSQSGIYTAGASTQVIGCAVINNGASALTGDMNGIYHQSVGRLLVNGCVIGNSAGTAQKVGVQVSNGQLTTVTGCDLTGNPSGAILVTTNVFLLTSVGNLPWGQATLVSGPMTVGSATGGPGAAGSVNVSLSYSVNGVAVIVP